MPLSPSDVTICIVTYNSADTLPACLKSLPSTSPVFVFDNNSRDNSADIVTQLNPNAKVIRSHKNIGFGNAHNALLATVETPFALLVNPDSVLQDGMVERLLETASEYQNASIIGPVSFDENGEEQFSFRPFEKGLTQPKSVEMISGAMPLLRISAFENNFFDPNIFLYYEDDDLCRQTRLKGWDLIIEPRAKIIHASGHSTGKSLKGLWFRGYHMGWSKCYLFQKDNGAQQYPPFARRFIMRKTKHLILKLASFDREKATICYGMICGSLAHLRQRPRIDSL